MQDDNSEASNCWSSIGVWGTEDNKCERLEEVVHCRNCEVFHQAGRTVFDRELLQEDVSLWTQKIARLKQQIDISDLSVISFRLNQQWFALPTQLFVQISQDGYSHHIPHRSKNNDLKLVNVGGTLYLLVSLHRTLGLEPALSNQIEHRLGKNRRLMLIYINATHYVVPVDEIGGVYRVDSKKINKPDEDNHHDMIAGEIVVGEHACNLIDVTAMAASIDSIVDEVL